MKSEKRKIMFFFDEISFIVSFWVESHLTFDGQTPNMGRVNRHFGTCHLQSSRVSSGIVTLVVCNRPLQ